MATLREKLDAAIAAQQGEVDRMVDVAKIELPKAQAVLDQLRGLSAQLEKNPDVEAGYVALKALGVKLDTE